MLLTKYTDVIWNARNKSRYTKLGYSFTHMGDTFLVDVNDLTPGSCAKVEVKCDYCGCVKEMTWEVYTRIKRKESSHKDACKKCLELKCQDSICEKYGSYSGLHNATNKQRKETNILKYGSENVFGSEIIKQKIVQSNLSKYGYKYTQQSPEVRQKTRNTCRDKYGVDNYVELFKGKFIKENSPVWKGGVEKHRVARSTHEYAQWRSDVFARDNYTCSCCGKKNGSGISIELHAHHLFNWKDFPDIRFNIDNGITLCSTCHYEFHSNFGKHNNTPEQYYNFISVKHKELDKKIC